MKNSPRIGVLGMLLAVMIFPLLAHAERMPPWAADATDTKAEYEPVFLQYRMMDAATPAAKATGSSPEKVEHTGHGRHEGHDMAKHRATPKSVDTPPAQSKPGAAGAPANDDAQHQHHH